MKVNGKTYKTIWYDEKERTINIIDQTKLPHNFVVKKISSLDEIIYAIKNMEVRGAPLLGGAAAYGMCLAIKKNSTDEIIDDAAKKLINSRPTAINISWAVEKIKSELAEVSNEQKFSHGIKVANKICDDDIESCQSIGSYGYELIKDISDNKKNKSLNILTHCNAGWLATIDWGTATAPIYYANKRGLNLHVWVDETRPRNQGSSLTSYEFNHENIANTIITDNAGGLLMQQGQIDLCITGADRIISDGSVINKIGTYLKALAAHANNIPFYVAVPTSSIDWDTNNANEVPIEERSGDELSNITGVDNKGGIKKIRIYPKESSTLNPAFDITPGKLVTGIITEKGVFNASEQGLKQLKTIS